jgi:hypothetical protein
MSYRREIRSKSVKKFPVISATIPPIQSTEETLELEENKFSNQLVSRANFLARTTWNKSIEQHNYKKGWTKKQFKAFMYSCKDKSCTMALRENRNIKSQGHSNNEDSESDDEFDYDFDDMWYSCDFSDRWHSYEYDEHDYDY